MNLQISDINDLTENRVNEFLCSVEHSLLYQSLEYLQLLKAYLRCEIKAAVATNDAGEYVGFLPFAITEKDGRSVCNSLPYFGSNSGLPVTGASEEERNFIRAQLFDVATRYIVGDRKCSSFVLITNPLDPEANEWCRNYVKSDLLDERIGQITPLPGQYTGDHDLLNLFDDPRPRNIRKAQKSGVTVRTGNSPEDLDFLFTTHHRNITSIGGLAKEKRFFDLVPRFFRDDQYKLYIAELNGTRIAALLLFYFNKTVEYFTPAIVEAHRSEQPASLLIFEAMKDAIRAGYKYWNWGGTWLSQGGVYDFKKKWGTQDYRYHYYVMVPDGSLKEKPKEYFTETFPNFYVIPFSALKKSDEIEKI